MGKQTMGRGRCGSRLRMVFTFLKDCLKTRKFHKDLCGLQSNMFIFTILALKFASP